MAHAAAYTYLNGFPKKSENPPTTAAVATAAVQLPLRIPLCGVRPAGGSDSSGRSEEKMRRRIRGARAQVLHLRVCMIYIICICTHIYIYIFGASRDADPAGRPPPPLPDDDGDYL